MNIQDIGLDLEISRRKLLASAGLVGRGAMAASLFAKGRPGRAVVARAGIADCRAAPAIW